MYGYDGYDDYNHNHKKRLKQRRRENDQLLERLRKEMLEWAGRLWANGNDEGKTPEERQQRQEDVRRAIEAVGLLRR